MLLLISDMLRRGAMTFFAIHSIYDLPVIELLRLYAFRRGLLEKGAMAFQAAGRDRPVKYGFLRVARTIGPLIGRCKKSNRHLEQPVIHPVQEGLSLGGRADHDVELFGPSFLALEIFHLVILAVPLFHNHFHRVTERKAIPSGLEAAPDIFPGSLARGEIVSRADMLVRNILMATGAALGACKFIEFTLCCLLPILFFFMDAPCQQEYARNDDEDR